ncbi:DUF4381 domain-containing protein [Sessilibacter corallicola]|uniref:DUF4381 domain-containing protein n=1 Tax=Sessilibacter corallicola TaxID=2904075 RepID=UPI001E366A1C|nr:DUF4381 domain-containing protein [Sessilibacter corallicola]MCE2029078.1 DUF4381 domain-containing protein [Sessilibacter corallicola]
MNSLLPNGIQAQAPADGNADPIPQLNDIILPEQLYSYSLAPGWFLVALAVIAIAVIVLLVWKKQQFKNRFKKLALKELNNWHTANKNEAISVDVLRHLNELLKRYVITVSGRKKVANLYGNQWQHFLMENGGVEESFAHMLAHDQYRNNAQFNQPLGDLVSQCQRFINTYNPELSDQSTQEGIVNA